MTNALRRTAFCPTRQPPMAPPEGRASRTWLVHWTFFAPTTSSTSRARCSWPLLLLWRPNDSIALHCYLSCAPCARGACVQSWPAAARPSCPPSHVMRAHASPHAMPHSLGLVRVSLTPVGRSVLLRRHGRHPRGVLQVKALVVHWYASPTPPPAQKPMLAAQNRPCYAPFLPCAACAAHLLRAYTVRPRVCA